MAFDKKPSTWLGAGYDLASHIAKFNTNDAASNKLLAQLTDAQGDKTTGDVRLLFYALCRMMQLSWETIGAVDINDLPAKMILEMKNRDGAGGAIRRTFTFQFDLDPDTTGVVDEPA